MVEPLVVHKPSSYGTGHLVLEKGYKMIKSGGRRQVREMHDFGT